MENEQASGDGPEAAPRPTSDRPPSSSVGATSGILVLLGVVAGAIAAGISQCPHQPWSLVFSFFLGFSPLAIYWVALAPWPLAVRVAGILLLAVADVLAFPMWMISNMCA